MASIHADKGRLVLSFYWHGARYREYTGHQDTKEGQALTKRLARQVDGELAANTFDYLKFFPNGAKAEKVRAAAAPHDRPLPFKDFAFAWMNLHKTFVAPETGYDRERMMLGKMIPHFGNRLVSSIRTEDVKKFIKYLRDHPHNEKVLGNRRINMVMQVLKLMLDQAVENGWLVGNPARAVKNLREVQADIDPLSLVEVELMLTKGFREPWEQHYFTVAFFSGIRPGEQIPLAWDSLDWNVDPPVILVRVGHTRRGGTGSTKTSGSKRPVDMRLRVQRAFSAQRALSQLRSDLVFPNSIGGKLDMNNLRDRVWKPALKRAGVRYRTMYQTRHTFATLMLTAGEDIGWIAKQLGHQDIQMIMKHYYRWVPRLTHHDGSLADKMLGGGK